MILTFHKIASVSKTYWWVANDDFARILDELSNKKFVYLDDYDPNCPDHVVVTFDGPYASILEFAAQELFDRKIPFEVYVIGDLIGKDNAFDSVEPLTQYCTIEELEKLMELGGRLQWHTRTHQLGTSPTTEKIMEEFTVPDNLKSRFPDSFKHFAYPHGFASEEMISIASTLFKSATAVDEGDKNNRFNLPRVTVGPGHSFSKPDLTLIVVNHNYGHLILECIESVRRQTINPSEVHVVDDYSTDDSKTILTNIAVNERLFLNESNLGIVDNFNTSLSRVETEFVMFLGADNYLHPNAIELITNKFRSNPEIDIIYFDMAIVGPLARNLATKINAKNVGKSMRDNLDVFIWEFPDFDDKAKESLKTSNIINGSSAYRVSAAKKVGGYKKTYPEDHNLWVRMVEAGSQAFHIPIPLLYYRQHSSAQANTALNSQFELRNLKKIISEIDQEKNRLSTQISELNQRLEKMLNSTSWKLTKPLRRINNFLKKSSK